MYNFAGLNYALFVFIKFLTLGCTLFGTIGNSLLLVMTYKCKNLHFSCGYILACFAVTNTICLFGEMMAWYRLEYGIINEHFKSCFYSHIFYIFTEFVDLYLAFATGLDRLLAITNPIWHRNLNLKVYLACVLAPGIIFGAVFVVLCFVFLEDYIMPVHCALISAIPVALISYIDRYINLCCLLCALSYGLIYLSLWKLEKETNNKAILKKQRNLVSTIIITVFLFVIAILLSVAYTIMSQFPELMPLAEIVGILRRAPALLLHSCDFYIYIWRSKEYRKAFLYLFNLETSTTVQSLRSTVSSSAVVVRHSIDCRR